jgi:hypothetical protein
MSGKWSSKERGFFWRLSSEAFVSNIRALLIAVTDPKTVEFVGYAARAASARQAPDFTLTPYIIQSLLLLLGPSFFAASIYMVLGRIIRLTGGERHSMIRPSWLTKIFVIGDVLSFFVQSSGEYNFDPRSPRPQADSRR